MINKEQYNKDLAHGANLENDIPQCSTDDQGGAIMDKDICLYNFISLWLDLFKKNEVKPATLDRLIQSNSSLKKYPIANERIVDLTALDVQSYINQIAEEGYSFSTIKKQLELLRASLRKAVRLKLIQDNPTEDIGMPNRKTIKKQKEVIAYDEKEQKKLQSYIDSHPEDNALLCVAFMIETGLRAGEALTLRWSDINIDKHKCSVHSTLINPNTPSKSYVQDSPKTDASIRTIPLNIRASSILTLLKHRATSEFVFGYEGARTNDEGRMDYPTLIRAVKRMCKETGVAYRGAHVFRHTFATNCYYKGVDIKILSRLLGHSDIKVTYNTYINLYGDGFDDMYAALCLS